MNSTNQLQSALLIYFLFLRIYFSLFKNLLSLLARDPLLPDAHLLFWRFYLGGLLSGYVGRPRTEFVILCKKPSPQLCHSICSITWQAGSCTNLPYQHVSFLKARTFVQLLIL